MVEWPSPQSSVQTIAYSPIRVGVITSVVSIPGTASDFWPNSGTQNAWITSSECSVSFTGPVDRQHELAGDDLVVAGVLELPRELLRGHRDAKRVRACVVVLGEHDRADDRDRGHEHAGTAVQTISRPVCPWIGGPSDSSSGWTRKLRIE